eukprot:69787_1
MGMFMSKNVIATSFNVPKFSTTMEMDDFLNDTIAKSKYPIPGLCIAVITKQKGFYFFNYGYANLQTKTKMTSKSIFHLYSGTKLFTATAIMQLWSKNKLSKLNINDSITKYLTNNYVNKYFTIKNTQNRQNLENITIRDLLTHSSGFKDKITGFMSIHLPSNTNNTYTTLDALTKYGNIAVPSRTNAKNISYCNFGYALLGEIITNSNPYNLSYKQYMKQFLFDPLKVNLSFSYNDFEDTNVTVGYIDKWSIMKPLMYYIVGNQMYKQLFGHKIGTLQGLNKFELYSDSIGGIIGNVEDLAKFVEFQMNGNDNILERKYLDDMQKEQEFGRVGIESKYGVGYGWKIGKTVDNRTFINHEGGGPGFHTEIRIYPEYDCGVVICCNYSSTAPQGMATFMHQISEIVFGSMDVIKNDSFR